MQTFTPDCRSPTRIATPTAMKCVRGVKKKLHNNTHLTHGDKRSAVMPSFSAQARFILPPSPIPCRGPRGLAWKFDLSLQYPAGQRDLGKGSGHKTAALRPSLFNTVSVKWLKVNSTLTQSDGNGSCGQALLKLGQYTTAVAAWAALSG